VCPSRSLALLAGLLAAAQAQAEYPLYTGERLTLGRKVWIENCETCHAYGVAGAPVATRPELWTERIAKGKQVLYEHALNGFYGPMGTMMPARGGNDALDDEEVTAAVDYMMRLAAPTSTEAIPTQ